MLPRIVLVEPQGALNVGSVARVMMNFGFNELFLVNPRCDLHSEDAFKMATHAKEILQKAKISCEPPHFAVVDIFFTYSSLKVSPQMPL